MNYAMMNPAMLLRAAASDFRTFVRVMWPILNPGTPLVWNWHLDAAIHILDETQARGPKRWICNMPPRTLKSQIFSVLWPAFLLGQNPAIRLIVASYADALAKQLSNDTRRLMQSDRYKEIFPGTTLDTQSSTHLTTHQGGTRYATTVGGSTTGFGADVIIIDDPHNAIEAYSESAREAVKNFFRQSLLSRGNDPPNTIFVLVMQRLHADDLAGHLLEQGGWELLKLQAEATEDASVPIGMGKQHQVKVGDLLLPTRLTRSFLDQQRLSMGSTNYEAQYQQDPTPADGAFIKRADLDHRYKIVPPRTDCRRTISLDTAVKTNSNSDYSVATVWQETSTGHHLLLDVWREKVTFPDLMRRMDGLFTRYLPEAILIEDAGSGSALIQTLKHRGLPAIPWTSRDGKQARLNSVVPYFESGQVLLPQDAPWLAAYIAELLGFPAARHDDQVDSTTQYLLWRHYREPDYLRVFWT